jgi:ATP-dependent DNA helicase RecQ
MSGRDALGVLPTGGGKSVCYQVPALALGGLTLVITPLVSLMEDQVVRARQAGLRAANLSAAQPASVKRATLQSAGAGRLDMLFVAPERLELDAFRAALAGTEVTLLAVDEAHCISEWGHDFRPAYRRIGVLRSGLRCPTLALTATATPTVREDVSASLALRRPLLVVRSFDRPTSAGR